MEPENGEIFNLLWKCIVSSIVQKVYTPITLDQAVFETVSMSNEDTL